jgi:hypothetical protein
MNKQKGQKNCDLIFNMGHIHVVEQVGQLDPCASWLEALCVL